MEQSKYAFLFALNVGESYKFDNKPTAAEGRRKVPPSLRAAYCRYVAVVGYLNKRNTGYRFKAELGTSPSSRIPGDLVVVTLIVRGDEVSSESALAALDKSRERRLKAWKAKKQAEDAPKLPSQLEEAEKAEHGRKVAAAVKAQAIHALGAVIDPVKLAELAVAHAQGQTIQRLTDAGWTDDAAPNWRQSTASYRIKPVRREFFLVVGRDGKPSAVASCAYQLPHHDPACRVRVREVTEEDEALA